MSRHSNAPQWTLFESATQPPPVGSQVFIPNINPVEFGWDEKVSQVLPPQVLTPLIANNERRGRFLAGAQAMGLVGRAKVLQPQQLLQADVLNMGEKFTGIMQPRRATKTNGVLAWLIGECLTRPDLSAAFTICTTGKATRAKFIKEVVPPLERVWPYEDDRPMQILRGAGAEMLKFRNGSFLSFVPFKGDSFRSDAFDIIVLDEAQDPEPEEAADVMGAIMPTLDTRPGAQVVIAGTAGEFQEGNLLWDELQKVRAGEPRHAGLIYEAPIDHEAVDVEALVSDWESVQELMLLCHPGIASGLTPMDAVQDNWRTLKPLKFAREYLGIFGKAASTSFISKDDWTACAFDGPLPTPPAHFRLGLAVDQNMRCWSLVAAWRDDEGRAHGLMVGSGPGVHGAYDEARRLHLKYRVPVAFDSGQASNDVVVARFDRTRPKTRTEPQPWASVSAGHATLWSDIRRRGVVHYGHEGMDQAATDVVKRGTKDAKRWAFGKPHEEADITPLEAWAVALKAYDEAPLPQQFQGIVTG